MQEDHRAAAGLPAPCNEKRRQGTDLAELIQSVLEMVRHLGENRGKEAGLHPRVMVWATPTGDQAGRC